MLQDISPKHLYNEYRPKEQVSDDDYVICFCQEEVLLVEGDLLDYPTYGMLKSALKTDAVRYIFSIDQEKYFLYDGNKVFPEKDNNDVSCRYIPMAEIRGHIVKPRYQQYALYTAKHLRDWYRDNKFCGRCGRQMHHSDTERCMVCGDCNFHSYPRIMPAVIVGVTNGDKILLTKYRTGYGHNALIAGFVEIGETIEECVQREVMEEAGVKVKNIRYYKSQPWGIPNDILVGYYCDVDGDDTITMDGSELKYADWVSREDIVLQPDDISLTNEMMKKFKNHEEI